jgi:hypothetical protein
MTYSQKVEIANNKFRNHTISQCDYAINDIHETLKLHPVDSDYSIKLLCELDAARDRKNKLGANRKCH